MSNINDIPADVSVITNLWVKLPNGTSVSTDGLSQKNFGTEEEAEAFKLGVEFLDERLVVEQAVVSDVAYGRDGYVVRVATGAALDVWSN